MIGETHHPIIDECLRWAIDIKGNASSLLSICSSDSFRDEVVSSFLDAYSPSHRTLSLALCHETFTHFKWLVALEPNLGTRLWIHEFKSHTGLGEPAYGEVPHNHRYSFVSTLLSGGYLEEIWSCTSQDTVTINEEIERSAGESHFVDSEWIHSLADVKPGTITFLLEGAAERADSRSWHRTGEARGTHITMAQRLPIFSALIRSLSDSS